MTEQPNPYSQPEEGSGVPIGEAKTPISKRGIWLLRFMVFVVPLALFGLYVIGFVTWLCDVALVSSNPELASEQVLHQPRFIVASPPRKTAVGNSLVFTGYF